MTTNKFIFSWEGINSYELYISNGIWSYDEGGKRIMFEHGGYTLTHIANKLKVGYGTPEANVLEYDFIFRFENKRDIIISKAVAQRNFPKAFSDAVKEIIYAAKFDSWEEYDRNKLYAKELDKLKRENEALRIQVEELKQQFALKNITM